MSEILISLKPWVGTFALYAMVLAGFIPLVVWACRNIGRQGTAFSLILCGFLYAMATKPNVSWDSVLENDGTHYTNNYSVVRFKWKKKDPTLPNAATVNISQKPNGGVDWTTVGSTTVGAFTYDLPIASTNYSFYVWTEYVPPTPVHTNGVWLGTVIEKAKGETGLNKLIIVNGQLIHNGVEIAPKSEE